MTTGEHVFYLREVGSEGFFTQYEITLCKQDGTKTLILGGEDGRLPHAQLDLNFDDESEFVILNVPMEAGDTLLLRSHQLPNGEGVCEDGGALMLIAFPGIHDSLYEMMDPSGDDPLAVLQFYLIAHCGIDFFFYAGSMGTVSLPTDSTSTNPAFDDVVAWAVSDETMQPTETVLTEVSPALLQNASLWIDMDGMALLFLLPHIQTGESAEEAWLGAIVANRHFDPAALSSLKSTPSKITVRGAAAVTFRLQAKMPTAGEQATLFFTSGLIAGTTLTLIDLTAEYPTYYYYVVTDEDVANGAIKRLALSSFVLSGGDGNTGFVGCKKEMMFQICYPNGQAPDAEDIGIGITEEPSELKLSFESTKTNEQILNDRVAEDSGFVEETLRIPSLTGRGYDQDDLVVLVLRLDDAQGNVMPLPAGFLVEPTNGKLTTYSHFAYASLGQVRYYAQEFNLSGKMNLDTLRYLGFRGKAVYEVIVLPKGTDIRGASFGGVEATVDTRISCNILVEETHAVILGENRITATRGEVIDFSVAIEGFENETREIEISLSQRVRDRMIYTEPCANLLILPDGKSVSLDENGKILETVTTGEGSFKISDTAEAGVYFITVYYHGRYAVCTLIVTD